MKASGLMENVAKEVETPKQLNQQFNLKQIDLEIGEGEFVCVIGDVGSGKTSLLNAIVGEMIHVPGTEIEKLGGPQATVSHEKLNELKHRILSPEYRISEPPVRVNGRLSYCE
jgi:ABC-type lipoprotein export system ATPase subunit